MKKSLGAKTIAYPTPVYVVGTYDAINKPNMMVAAWAGICCSKPAAVAVSLRMATYSYQSLVEKGAFTVSIPGVKHAAEADYAGMASGRDSDKFAMTDLTPTKSKLVDAPYVEEFPLVLECRLMHTKELGLHTLFVGEIQDVKVDENCLDDNGKPDITKIDPLIFAPEVRAYYRVGEYVGQAFSMGKKYL